MKRTRILTCSIMGIIFTLILAGYARTQQALDTETKLKQTVISIQIPIQLPLVRIMVFLTEKAKCDLSFQIKNDEGQAGSVPATGTTQGFDIVVLKMSNHLYVARMAATNVPAYDLFNALIDKAGLTWRISEKGAVVVVSDNATYSGIEKDYEQLKSLRKSFSTDQVKRCVCREYENKSNDYTSVISGSNNYYVLASSWIEQRRGERSAYMAILDKMGESTFEYSIYIVSTSLPSNIKEMFDGPDAGVSALRVSPRGVVGSPVWDRLGERIAYVRVSEDKKEGNIVILDVKNGRETVYSGLGMRPVPPYWSEISWDESGRHIAFVDANDMICLLDLKDQTFRGIWKCNFEPGSMTLSPDGKYVCFMTQWATVDTNSQSLTISYRGQKVQEPEGSSPILCVETNIYEMDKWTMNIVNIQKQEVESVSREKYNIGILLPPLLWMPDSKSIVMRTFAPNEKGKCVSSYYLYRVAEKKLEPYSGDQKLPYCQSWRYWGVKGEDRGL